MTDETHTAALESIAPFFVVDDITASTAFYVEKLGFTLSVLLPADDPFFAIVRRGPVSLLLKQIGADTPALPNHHRHEWARWDALINTREPDALCAEFRARGVLLHAPLADTDDGLRAFEVCDLDGYVLCFARPPDVRPA